MLFPSFSVSWTFLFFLFPLYSFFDLLAFCLVAIFNFFCCIFVFFPAFSYSNLDRWSESSSPLFKFISIWCVWFFYCYYFAERFSLAESFEIQSSNIRNDVIRMKYWMKQGVNRCNIKTELDDPENVGRQIFIQHDFSSSNMIFSFFAIFAFC